MDRVLIVLEYVTMAISVIGSFVIAWGVVLSTAEYFRLGFFHKAAGNTYVKMNALRQHLGYHLLLGLEFLIAADIINTVIRPDLNEMAILASTVVIRTILSYFLNKELGLYTST